MGASPVGCFRLSVDEWVPKQEFFEVNNEALQPFGPEPNFKRKEKKEAREHL